MTVELSKEKESYFSTFKEIYKKEFVLFGDISFVQTLTASAVKPSSKFLDIGLPTMATPTS